MNVYIIDEPIAGSTVRSPADPARQGQAGVSDLEQNVRPWPLSFMFFGSNDLH